MENKKAVFIAAAIALLIAALIVGAIIFLTNLLRGRSSGPTVVTSSPSPVVTASPSSNTPVTSQNPSTPNNSKYIGIGGYSMSYPANWGVLRCTNSTNVEFDPYNPMDQTAVCDYAVKPVTVLVATAVVNCPGEQVLLGGNRVIRSKIQTQTSLDYRWCVFGNSVTLDITHRVSSTGSRATSKDDFSAKVEEMISSMRMGGAS